MHAPVACALALHPTKHTLGMPMHIEMTTSSIPAPAAPSVHQRISMPCVQWPPSTLLPPPLPIMSTTKRAATNAGTLMAAMVASAKARPAFRAPRDAAPEHARQPRQPRPAGASAGAAEGRPRPREGAGKAQPAKPRDSRGPKPARPARAAPKTAAELDAELEAYASRAAAAAEAAH